MGKSVVNLVGVILVIIGLAGFFNDPLFGVFDVNAGVNFFHLIAGILALSFGNASEMAARNFALLFGIIFALLMVISFANSGTRVAGLTINTASAWLYLLFTVLLLPTGLARHPERTQVRSV